jgi:hypothetical protein
MTPGRLTGAALDIATAAAERRPAGRNGCTSGRNRPRRANSNRGSARARCFGHRSISFRDISRARPAFLCSVRVEENPRKVTPSGFNAGRGRRRCGLHDLFIFPAAKEMLGNRIGRRSLKMFLILALGVATWIIYGVPAARSRYHSR